MKLRLYTYLLHHYWDSFNKSPSPPTNKLANWATYWLIKTEPFQMQIYFLSNHLNRRGDFSWMISLNCFNHVLKLLNKTVNNLRMQFEKLVKTKLLSKTKLCLGAKLKSMGTKSPITFLIFQQFQISKFFLLETNLLSDIWGPLDRVRARRRRELSHSRGKIDSFQQRLDLLSPRDSLKLFSKLNILP